MFPWHFGDTFLCQNVWKTTSWEHHNHFFFKFVDCKWLRNIFCVISLYVIASTQGPVPVCLRGEDSEHGWPVVDLQHVGQRLQDVKVKEGVARHGAVEAGLKEGRPVALQHPRRAAVVVLANSGDTGEDHLRRSSGGAWFCLWPPAKWVARSSGPSANSHLSQSGVLHRDLAEEEVDVVAVLDGVKEVRLWLKKERGGRDNQTSMSR